METNRLLAQGSPAESNTVVAFEQARRGVLIHESKLFSRLSRAECTQIAAFARPRSFHKRDVLFSQGQPFRKLILLESGCVKLTSLNANGTEVIFALRGAGEAIYLPNGGTHSIHSCTCQAIVPGRALIWNASLVENMMMKLPQLTENMYLILHQQMHELEQRYHEVASDSVARRLACTLIRLANQFGQTDGQGVKVYISRQELAQMSGMTIFTVSRLISKWAESGLVVAHREAILVLRPQSLEDLTSIEESQKGNTTPALH